MFHFWFTCIHYHILASLPWWRLLGLSFSGLMLEHTLMQKCQHSKIHRHIRALFGQFSLLETCYRYVHIDLVGPWPVICSFSYLLTCIDRFAHWPEAILIVDISAESIARAFVSNWIVHFGVSAKTLTMHTSPKLPYFMNYHIHTTIYHPASNGMVKRFHRWPKVALHATPDPQSCTEFLPIALLACSIAVKTDLGFFLCRTTL